MVHRGEKLLVVVREVHLFLQEIVSMTMIAPLMVLAVVVAHQTLAQAVIKMSLRFALVAYLSILSGCAASPKYAVGKI